MALVDAVIRYAAGHRKSPPPVHKPWELETLLRRIWRGRTETERSAPIQEQALGETPLREPVRRIWRNDGHRSDDSEFVDSKDVGHVQTEESEASLVSVKIVLINIGVRSEDGDIASEEFATLEVADQDAAEESLAVVEALDVCAEDAPRVSSADDILKVVNVCDELPDGTSCDVVTLDNTTELVSDLLAIEATLDAVDDICADDAEAGDMTEVVEGVKLGANDAACEDCSNAAVDVAGSEDSSADDGPEGGIGAGGFADPLEVVEDAAGFEDIAGAEDTMDSDEGAGSADDGIALEVVEVSAGFEETSDEAMEAVEDPGGFEEPTKDAVEAVTEARAEDEESGATKTAVVGELGLEAESVVVIKTEPLPIKNNLFDGSALDQLGS
ncbi:hypothetical protein N0V86_006893 [Didymella sp. IMI 355093]|nr:hypothetical protein N0V86_006893 [Didymella sp. IMI 355093]